VPSLPVKPCTITLESLFTRTLIEFLFCMAKLKKKSPLAP
jgi:hypothetical protein